MIRALLAISHALSSPDVHLANPVCGQPRAAGSRVTQISIGIQGLERSERGCPTRTGTADCATLVANGLVVEKISKSTVMVVAAHGLLPAIAHRITAVHSPLLDVFNWADSL